MKKNVSGESGVFFGIDAGDDELDFDKFIVVLFLGVESGSGGTFDVGGSHAGGFNVLLGNTVLNEELFNGFGTFEGDELVVFGVDAIGLNPAFDGEGYVGMILEHLDVVHEVGVGLVKELVLVTEIDVGDGINSTTFGSVEFHAKEGVLFKTVGVEIVEDGEVAITFCIKRVVEAGDEFDTATAEVLVVDDDAVVGVLFEDGEVDVEVFTHFGVVEGYGDFESFDKDGDLDAVAGTFGGDVVEKNVIDFAFAHIDRTDVAFVGGFGKENVFGFVVHADGAFGGLFFLLLTG